MMGHCTCQYVVEADGGVYPCDFYVLDGYRLGDIGTQDFPDFDKKRRELQFIEKSLVPMRTAGHAPSATCAEAGAAGIATGLTAARFKKIISALHTAPFSLTLYQGFRNLRRMS